MIWRYPPSFLQNHKWLKFWVTTNNQNHNYYEISAKDGETEILAYVYQYPWYFGQKFLYLPKGPLFKHPTNQNIDNLEYVFLIFLKKLLNLARKMKCSFIKIDFDDTFTQTLDLQDNEQILAFLHKLIDQKTLVSETQIQDLELAILDLKDIKFIKIAKTELTEKIEEKEELNLLDIYTHFDSFWQKTNPEVRKFTKKSLKLYKKGFWSIDQAKTDQNFQEFWQIYSQSSQSQNPKFKQSKTKQSKKYLEELFLQDFSRLIILKDDQGISQAAWLGISLNHSLIQLLCHHTQHSLDNYGQYLIQLLAIKQAQAEDCDLYNMGKYDDFAKSYNSILREFLGPIDILVKPLTYNFISFFHSFRQNLKKLRKS